MHAAVTVPPWHVGGAAIFSAVTTLVATAVCSGGGGEEGGGGSGCQVKLDRLESTSWVSVPFQSIVTDRCRSGCQCVVTPTDVALSGSNCVRMRLPAEPRVSSADGYEGKQSSRIPRTVALPRPPPRNVSATRFSPISWPC